MTKIISRPDRAPGSVLVTVLLLFYIRWMEFIPGSEGRGGYQHGIAGKRGRSFGSVIFIMSTANPGAEQIEPTIAVIRHILSGVIGVIG